MKNFFKTSLYDTHIKLGAKMINYSGFYMPLQYTSSIKEHIYVRKYSGIFDVSHMGKLIIKGKSSKDFIQRLTTNDLNEIKIGMAQYTCLINNKGGIIDDLIIYQLNKYEYLLIVNAINIEKNKNWIINNIKLLKYEKLELIDISNNNSLLSIQGPLSMYYIKQLTSIPLEQIHFYHFRIGKICGIDNILISRTGYTGSIGFEILVSNKYVKEIWNQIINIGNGKIIPCGIASRDSLRLEMGYRLYGKDISEKITPIESGLSWIVKFTKKFISREILEKQKKTGFHKKFISFFIRKEDNFIPRNGYSLVDKNKNKVGIITSGNYSPILKKCIGLGYLFKNDNEENLLFIIARGKKIPIFRKKIPFIKINNL
ncbi:glycine cleavage system aminomethyltransferase GcvT [Blattabacterium cuenoti]|uniref:glycine cleavage system aminomethyltransferase GcvT n=1 Tax=Blattabacterium cuenoti TaxID=1653831 RepID=UPI00163BA930|nr:glycine cleavage system aminomethyltransferase GcvT [Blattabacterium cuenoti]